MSSHYYVIKMLPSERSNLHASLSLGLIMCCVMSSEIWGECNRHLSKNCDNTAHFCQRSYSFPSVLRTVPLITYFRRAASQHEATK